MVENYTVEEAIEFCSEFIAGVSSIGLNSSVIKRDSNVDRALSVSSFIRLSKEQLDQAHLYAIQNVALALEVTKNSITPSLRWIAHRPSPDGATYSSYMINGYYYHTKKCDDIRRVQNSGCDWVDNRSGIKVDELGFSIVDLKLVLTSSQRTIEEDFFEDEIGDMLQECGYETIQRMPNVDTPNETDDTTSTYIRHDCEGRWVEKGSINNIVAVATIVEDNISYPNVKVLVDVVTGENLTIPNPVKGKIETLNQALVGAFNQKDVVYSSNYTNVNGTTKFLNRHAMNNMKNVDMICILMDELIFGSDKFVYLAREDLLHYCSMVEIGYMCILAYITGLKTWQAKHDLQRYRSTPKWRPVKFNTKSAYRQEEIDEIRTKWAAFVSRFV
ncbi:transposase [Cucumis melo var. makuwa]|uniref:Transposase n=1 Tax=Cucumis melo var. makuwa TaxID=1194695 RepID=A0A5D3C4L5_CUCMM|nr:transposase [Cucumis melo var. makuwa]